MQNKNASIQLFSVVILFILILLNLSIGSADISFSDIFDFFFKNEKLTPTKLLIIKEYRLPKTLTAILAGSALAISGLQMQTIFRNPLAGPYILGVSSGASLGVALVYMGASWLLPAFLLNEFSAWAPIIGAFIGASSVMLLVLIVSVRIRDVMTILILGIMFGGISSAIVSILQYFSSQSMLKSFIVWTLGSLSNVTNDDIGLLSIFVGIGILLTILTVKHLNVLLIGENYAKTLGVNIRILRIVVFISTSILAGSITAYCGPIGFVGIAVPHISRMILRTSNHRNLLFLCFTLGAGFMLLCDIIAQLPGSEKLLPINSVTAMLGIPFIIYIIVKKRKVAGSW